MRAKVRPQRTTADEIILRVITKYYFLSEAIELIAMNSAFISIIRYGFLGQLFDCNA